MTQRWRLLDERPGSSGYLSCTSRRYRLPDATVAVWDIFGPRRTVAVLALTDDDEVVLARQYRPGPDAILDELPGGIVEEHEDVLAAAERELREETGYGGTSETVGQTWLAAASRTERFVVIVRNAQQIAAPHNDEGEFCEVLTHPLSEFRTTVREGRLTDVDLAYLALDHLGRL